MAFDPYDILNGLGTGGGTTPGLGGMLSDKKPSSGGGFLSRLRSGLGAAGRYLAQPGQEPQMRLASAPSGYGQGRLGGGGQYQEPQITAMADPRANNGLFPRFYSYGAMKRGGGVGALRRASASSRANQPAGGSTPGPAGGSPPGMLRGPGGGQDDQIIARVSPGEFIFDAETVAMAGDGNNEEGARKLEALRANLRDHKGFQANSPKAKPQLAGYLRSRNK